MIPDFTPLFYLAFMAFGALIGMGLTLVAWFFSIWFAVPTALFVLPPIVGAVGGLLWGLRVK